MLDLVAQMTEMARGIINENLELEVNNDGRRFRISGLASGYDTAQLIEQLIALERKPVLQMQKKRIR